VYIIIKMHVYLFAPMHRNAGNFSVGDSFVGYQADTPAAIVFKIFQEVDFTKLSNNKQWEKEVCTIFT